MYNNGEKIMLKVITDSITIRYRVLCCVYILKSATVPSDVVFFLFHTTYIGERENIIAKKQVNNVLKMKHEVICFKISFGLPILQFFFLTFLVILKHVSALVLLYFFEVAITKAVN